MTEIQFLCFRDWKKWKEAEIYSTNLEETFQRLAKDVKSFTHAFVKGWESGRKEKTGLI
jgi:hypothetical protein